MKKNLVIALLAVVSVLSLYYGSYQKNEADRFKLMAEENGRQAIEMRDAAEQARDMANHQRMLVEEQRIIAEAIRQKQISEAKLHKK